MNPILVAAWLVVCSLGMPVPGTVPAEAAAVRAPDAPQEPAPAPPADSAPVWRPAYRFAVGDTIEFKFPYAPELDFSAPVRPDGALSFPYLGDVVVMGETVPLLLATLEKRYEGILRSPEITIIVRSFQPLRVFVTGEVPTPGRVDFRPGMTVAQAVAAAGGFRDTANRKEVVLLRPATPTALRVSMVSLARRGSNAGDQPLAPDDIVVVPKSKIAKLGQVIGQYTRDLLPVSSLGVFFDLVGTTGASAVIGGGAP
jgi:protein involved in polysaccharide export with SLBB domain